MFQKKFMGWSALVLFVVATAILAILLVLLVFSPALEIYVALDPQAMIVASGVLALAAAVLGFYAFKTSPGKVGAIGGLVLVLAVAVLLSLTTITRVERHSVEPPQPTVQSAEP